MIIIHDNGHYIPSNVNVLLHNDELGPMIHEEYRKFILKNSKLWNDWLIFQFKFCVCTFDMNVLVLKGSNAVFKSVKYVLQDFECVNVLFLWYFLSQNTVFKLII